MGFLMGMGNNFVGLALLLAAQQFLQTNDTGDEQSQFTDDQGLEGEQGDTTDQQGQQGGGLQFHQQQQRQQQFLGLLLLATGCNGRETEKNEIEEISMCIFSVCCARRRWRSKLQKREK
jgi:hypothetical protein